MLFPLIYSMAILVFSCSLMHSTKQCTTAQVGCECFDAMPSPGLHIDWKKALTNIAEVMAAQVYCYCFHIYILCQHGAQQMPHFTHCFDFLALHPTTPLHCIWLPEQLLQ